MIFEIFELLDEKRWRLFQMSHWWKFYTEPSQSNIWFHKPGKRRVYMQGTVELLSWLLSYWIEILEKLHFS